jgi:hypothetical protein
MVVGPEKEDGQDKGTMGDTQETGLVVAPASAPQQHESVTATMVVGPEKEDGQDKATTKDTKETGLVVAPASAPHQHESVTATMVVGTEKDDHQDKETTKDILDESPQGVTIFCHHKRDDNEEKKEADNDEFSRPRTRRRLEAMESPEKSTMTTENNPVSISPENSKKTNTNKEDLEHKRVQLIDILAKRKHMNGEKDAISEKIQAQVDNIDEQLLAIILT